MGLLNTSNQYTTFLSEEEFDRRFYYALNTDKTKRDRAGYGPGKPFIPPLQNP